MKTLEYKWLGQNQDFKETLALQEARVQEVIAERAQPGTFYFLEHAPVYTIGLRRKEAALPIHLPHPVVQINRGGLATYHGPGQLVGYLVTDLIEVGKDLHKFLRTMEEALIQSCESCGIKAGRKEGLTGVWSHETKIASMGVGVRKWVSMHGFALNITPESLPPFDLINPCGIDGVQMSCLHHQGEWRGSPEEFSKAVFQNMERLLYAQDVK